MEISSIIITMINCIVEYRHNSNKSLVVSQPMALFRLFSCIISGSFNDYSGYSCDSDNTINIVVVVVII